MSSDQAIRKQLASAFLLFCCLSIACALFQPAGTQTPASTPAIHPGAISPTSTFFLPQTFTPPPTLTATPPVPPTATAESTILTTPTQTPPTGELALQNQADFGLWNQVLALAYSPGDRWLAAAVGDNLLILDSETLEEVDRFRAGVWANGLTFLSGPDKLLAWVSKNGILGFWEIETGRSCQKSIHLKGANGVTANPIYSVEGPALATSGNDGAVRVWTRPVLADDLTCQLTETAEILGGSYNIPGVVFDSTGQRLAAIHTGLVRIREVATQRLLVTLGDPVNADHNPVYAIAFSPDDRWLAAAQSGPRLVVWDAASGEMAFTLSPSGFIYKNTYFNRLAFSPDGRWLAGGTNAGRIILWELSSERGPIESAAWEAHHLAVSGLVFSADSHLLFTLKVWKLN
jgi:WD40 repeat protein